MSGGAGERRVRGYACGSEEPAGEKKSGRWAEESELKRREQQSQQVGKREARGARREVVATRQGERSVVGVCVVGVW